MTGPALASSDPMAADLVVPNPDYVVTLDADSMLLPGYCLRLVHLLEQNEHRDMAIAQTPYSASPARPPGWSGSRAPPPTSSTSSTRA